MVGHQAPRQKVDPEAPTFFCHEVEISKAVVVIMENIY